MLPLWGKGFSLLSFSFSDLMQSLVPSPGFPFGKPVGDELFRAWLQHPRVLQLNPWSMAAPASFLKGAWCRYNLETRPIVLSVLLVACLAGAVVTAAEGASQGIPFCSFMVFPPPSSFLQILFSWVKTKKSLSEGGCGAAGWFGQVRCSGCGACCGLLRY